jgi:prepilin-type processing-associated H-X9-DG protein
MLRLDLKWEVLLSGGGGGGFNNVPAVQPQSAWDINGMSYAINWYWAEGPPWDGGSSVYDGPSTNDTTTYMHAAGGAMLSKKVGGAAARFAIFYENLMNGFMYSARPPNSISQGLYGRVYAPSQLIGQLVGWHKKVSRYNIGFFDGHAENRFVDTRFTHHEGMTTWPEPNTPKGY